MQNIDKEFDRIYAEMRSRNLGVIETSGLKNDSQLNVEGDDRKGLGLFAFYDEFESSNFELLHTEAKSAFNSQVIYHPDQDRSSELPAAYEGLLHFTFFQIHPVADVLPQEILRSIPNYVPVLAESLFKLEPFTIELKGTMAVPTGVLLYGYPDQDINAVRSELRVSLHDNHLPFTEPYISNIAHSTFVRLANPCSPEVLVTFSQKYAEVPVGKLHVSKLYFGYGTWRMRPDEIEMFYKFDLGTKLWRKMLH